MANMSPQDFDQLCRSIEQTINQVSKAVGKGLDAAGDAVSDAINQAMNGYKRAQVMAPPTPPPPPAPERRVPVRQAPPQRDPLVRARFRSTAGLTAGGIALVSIGGICTLAFGLATIMFSLMSGLGGIMPSVGAAIGSGVLTAVSAGSMVAGIKRLRVASNLKSFQRVFGNREVCSIPELAAQTNMTPKKALNASRKILKYGLLPQGRLSDDGTFLMVTDDVYRQYRHAQATQKQRALEQREAEAARLRAKSHHVAGELSQADQAFIYQGRTYVGQLRDLDIAIDDEQISAKIVSIEDIVTRILERATEEPTVIDGLERMMDYYLPTTVKLLAAYEDLEEQPIQGQNITSSRTEIEQTLDLLIGAYEKLLDATYQDLSMDVSSDISVLTAMLAQEGLTESPFDQKK